MKCIPERNIKMDGQTQYKYLWSLFLYFQIIPSADKCTYLLVVFLFALLSPFSVHLYLVTFYEAGLMARNDENSSCCCPFNISLLRSTRGSRVKSLRKIPEKTSIWWAVCNAIPHETKDGVRGEKSADTMLFWWWSQKFLFLPAETLCQSIYLPHNLGTAVGKVEGERHNCFL